MVFIRVPRTGLVFEFCLVFSMEKSEWIPKGKLGFGFCIGFSRKPDLVHTGYGYIIRNLFDRQYCPYCCAYVAHVFQSISSVREPAVGAEGVLRGADKQGAPRAGGGADHLRHEEVQRTAQGTPGTAGLSFILVLDCFLCLCVRTVLCVPCHFVFVAIQRDNHDKTV